MANPQSNVTLEDRKGPVPATTASERPSSSTYLDSANAAPTSDRNKLAFAESTSTSFNSSDSTSISTDSSMTMTALTGLDLTPIGLATTRSPAMKASDGPTPKDQTASTISPVVSTDHRSSTTAQLSPPSGASVTSTLPVASSKTSSSSTSIQPTETWSSNSIMDSSSTYREPPSPESTWQSSSSSTQWSPSPAETLTPSSTDSWYSPPIETSSSSWTSDRTESTDSWIPPIAPPTSSPTSAYTSSMPSATISRIIPTIPPDTETIDSQAATLFTELSMSSGKPTILPISTKGGVLTTSAHIVTSTGLVIHGNSTVEASSTTDEVQTKKIAGMSVGWFSGLIVAICVALIAGGIIFARWHKKRSETESSLDGFEGDQETKRPITGYDASFAATRSPDRASSFFNSSSSSKFVTPVTPHQDDLDGQGNTLKVPTVPAPAAYIHPRASRYMPTSGRVLQPPSAHSPSDQSGMGAHEVLADYYPDNDAEQLDEPKSLLAAKRKTTATTRTGSTGSIYSIDSVWGNASEAPPPTTARSSLDTSILPWRPPDAETPAVPTVSGNTHPRTSSQTRYPQAHEQVAAGPTQNATRLPPRAAIAQTPVGVRQKPGFGEGGFVLPLGGFSR